MKIQVIIGSTRQKRFANKPANWIYEGDTSNPFDALKNQANAFLDQLIWWTKALKTARKE